MTTPRYDYVLTSLFGGIKPETCSYEQARAVVLPVPLELTTSYVPGTRNAPREILLASTHMELWEEETGTDAQDLRVFTLPEMELPFRDVAGAVEEISRVTGELADAGKFVMVLGGEHSITPGVVAALARRTPGLSVLQIDAHADLRESYMDNRFSHASAIRRTLEHAPCTQVAIRSLSRDEAVALPSLPTRIFFDFDMRRDPAWMDRVVDSLSGQGLRHD